MPIMKARTPNRQRPTTPASAQTSVAIGRARSQDVGEVAHAPALVVARGLIVSAKGQACVTFVSSFGHRCEARLCQAVDGDWLAAALAVGPVQAEGTIASDGSGSIWAVFPGPEHAEGEVAHRQIGAQSSLSLSCGGTVVSLSSTGRVEIRGREVIARGSRVTRLQGGSIRLG